MSGPKTLPSTIKALANEGVNEGDPSAQLHFANHPPDLGGLAAGVYNPPGKMTTGKSDPGGLLEAVSCPYCHKHISDCRCEVT